LEEFGGLLEEFGGLLEEFGGLLEEYGVKSAFISLHGFFLFSI
jgi:hypothetical protein